MAINSDIRDHAYQFFIEEAPDLCHLMEASLLTLRQEKNTAKVHDLMRAAHSLKGGSASVGLNAIEALAHRLETIFKALYSETVKIDTDLESQLLAAYDCLRLPLMEQIKVGHFDAEQALAHAEPIFAQIEEHLGDALLQTDVYIPSSADLGVNMALSIFEVDVGAGLKYLEAIATNPQNYQVAGELRAQAEVFAGFAELLNQAEFGVIAQTTLTALETNPDCVLEILKLAIADFQRCRQAVLANNTTDNISPSEALVALTNSTINHLPISKEATADTLSLEDVFGSIFAISEVDADVIIETGAAVFPELEKSPLNAAQTPIPAIPETLELAVQSIEEIFDSLPIIEELSAPISQLDVVELTSLPTPILPAETNLIRTEELGIPDALVMPNLTIRVDAERLERMNNLVGELAINRNGLSLQNEQLQGSVKGLLNRFAKVQSVVSQLRELSDQMVVGASTSRLKASHPSFLVTSGVNGEGDKKGIAPLSFWSVEKQNIEAQQATNSSDFDSLELDSYGALHSQLQALLEDMMQIEEAVEDIALFAKATDKTLEQQQQNMTHLRDELMWARMLPLSEVINRFPRVLRDLSATYQKPVNLKLSGTGVLVDKAILEKLADPLLHLLRNAFDHGIESPEIRSQQGKNKQGQIEIRAYHKGSQTIIEVRDDGQGLNWERIRQKVLELNWLSVQQLAQTSNDQLSELIFEPGFSTATQVSELSGRGVGLDVVRLQLRALKGTVSVSSIAGVGTTFILKLPLTLTIANLLICLVGNSALAFPADSIEEIIIPKAKQIKQSGTQRFLYWHKQIAPIYRLADLLNYNCPLLETTASKVLAGVPSPTDWEKPMLILRQGVQIFALEIERLVTEQELVIKSFGEAIAPPSFTYGCTILGDGSLIPVVDATLLLEIVVNQSPAHAAISTELELRNAIPLTKQTQAHTNFMQPPSARDELLATPTQTAIKTRQFPTVLVVDDAVALRRTLALTLERAGFRVLQAPDGREAIIQLQQSSAIELIICDIEMPNMNGFELLGVRRQDPQLSKIPVVMLTSRSNDKHQRLAMQLGATGYFTKPYIEQEFLKAIKEIIAQ